MLSDLTPFRTDLDYESALLELERLWGAPPGTPEGDRLGRLTEMIEDWEERNRSMDPSAD